MTKLLKMLAIVGVLATPVMANALSGKLYKSPYCGCCEMHGKYISSKNITLRTIESDDRLAHINKKYLLTDDTVACHTIELGGYGISGHIPIEAINKLLSEKPDIIGLTVPGMPTYSPGMMEPTKDNPSKIEVLAIHKDGSFKPYGVFEYSGDKFFE